MKGRGTDAEGKAKEATDGDLYEYPAASKEPTKMVGEEGNNSRLATSEEAAALMD